jgi:hypothetical protein
MEDFGIVEQRTTDLGITGICIKDIAEKFTGNGDAGDDEPVDIVWVNNEGPAGRFCADFGHAVKVDEKGKEDLICGWAVLEDAEEVSFETDGRDVAGVEG